MPDPGFSLGEGASTPKAGLLSNYFTICFFSENCMNAPMQTLITKYKDTSLGKKSPLPQITHFDAIKLSGKTWRDLEKFPAQSVFILNSHKRSLVLFVNRNEPLNLVIHYWYSSLWLKPVNMTDDFRLHLSTRQVIQRPQLPHPPLMWSSI